MEQTGQAVNQTVDESIDQALVQIEACGFVAVMRGAFPPSVALHVAETLMQEQLTVFEFTMNSEQPLEAMKAVKRAFGSRALVGMGTVLDVDTAQRALDGGADFIVAPSFSRAVMECTHAAGRLAIPGVMTPTECADAWAAGARLLKLFPAGTLGIDYFNALRAPFNQMRFMCNGGMSLENAPHFLAAGAAACGIAGWLTGDGHQPLDVIAARARQLRDVLRLEDGSR